VARGLLPMVRIRALGDVADNVRQHILGLLQPDDDVVVLPQAYVSSEGNSLKNVVLNLDGSQANVSPDVFSPNWFSGVSLVRVQKEKAEYLLHDPARRAQCLRLLADAIPSEMHDANVQVGPQLDGDEHNRDASPWTPGFDSPGCCVGLYSAFECCPPRGGSIGMSRGHAVYYLACKAGAGTAGQTFHSRLVAALKQGRSLDEALCETGSLGTAALQRVASAAKRNRGRILIMAAEALGIRGIETIGDNMSATRSPHRLAVAHADSCYNSLLRVKTNAATATAESVWQYAAGCVAADTSESIIASSNVPNGFVLFTTLDGHSHVGLRNSACSCAPFCTQRLVSNKDAMLKQVDEYKAAARNATDAHPDHEWVHKRFAWKSKMLVGKAQRDMEPACLWGTHASDHFLRTHVRELGMAELQQVRIRPEVVALSATEPGKLRIAARALKDL